MYIHILYTYINSPTHVLQYNIHLHTHTYIHVHIKTSKHKNSHHNISAIKRIKRDLSVFKRTLPNTNVSYTYTAPQSENTYTSNSNNNNNNTNDTNIICNNSDGTASVSNLHI